MAYTGYENVDGMTEKQYARVSGGDTRDECLDLGEHDRDGACHLESSYEDGDQGLSEEALEIPEGGAVITLELGEEVSEIEGFPNYWVTSFGRVVSGPNHCHPGRFIQLKSQDTGKGYHHVSLSLDGRLHTKEIAPLVARAFIPNPDGKLTVNHIKGDQKTNNRVDNLEWATNKEQTDHAIATGLWALSEDWCIHRDTRERAKDRPFQVQIKVDGKRSWGHYATRDEARQRRDEICEKYGILHKVRE